MSSIPVACPRHTWETATYPYLVIRVMPAVYSIRPLPADVGRDVLLALAWSVMDAHERRFRLCLVLGPSEAIFLEPDGRQHTSDSLPSGGVNLDVDPSKTEYLPS
jgi:hypothetical protein